MAIPEESLGKMFSFVESLVRNAGVTVREALINDKKVETKVGSKAELCVCVCVVHRSQNMGILIMLTMTLPLSYKQNSSRASLMWSRRQIELWRLH